MGTGIKLIAENKSVVYARTLEFGVDLESNIIVVPRNYNFQATSISGKQDGMQWKSQYAVTGANAYTMPVLLDGVNEKGLAGGIFYFPDYAQYQEVTPTEQSISIAPWELLTWLLTSFKSVEEIKLALPTIRVCKAVFGPWGSTPPVHYILHDSTGNSLAVEYRQGILYMYDNPLGVFTNAPSFEWHITNLNNYINLSSSNIDQAELGPLKVKSFGQGSGMLGLPGDFTPPSRFVRAAFFTANTAPMKNEYEAWFQAFHILQLFNIPRGIVRKEENNKLVFDCTLWTSASDLKNRCYFFHTYDNPTVRKIDLMSMNLDAKEIGTISMKSPYFIDSLTKVS